MTILKDTLKDTDIDGLTIESFGDIVDDAITDSNVQMFINFPEGTKVPVISDNLGACPVIQFYILLHGLTETFSGFVGMLHEDLLEDFVDALLANVVKPSFMGVINERRNT